jgi:hypothetical protein
MAKNTQQEGASRSGFSTLIDVARAHPGLTGALACSMVIGSCLAWFFMPTDISDLRRILGGALLGLLSWLLVMMGRLLD